MRGARYLKMATSILRSSHTPPIPPFSKGGIKGGFTSPRWFSYFLCIGLLFSCLLVISYTKSVAAEVALEVSGLEDGIRQGDAALIRVRSSVHLDSLSGEFEGKTIYFQGDDGRSFTALLGIGMDMKPGRYDFLITGKSPVERTMRNFSFDVHRRDYKVERLSLPRKMVSPDMSVLDRIRRESRALGRVREMMSEERFWDGDFVVPANGVVANNFGARRVLNGVSKKPHSGVDIKAFAGSRVRSPNSGKVVYVDVMYYGGKTVVIDHGHGLSTLYMHLSKILVNHGEEVEKGEVIGLVGSTGRSTGPHLHWGAYLNGSKIDPTSLLRIAVDDSIEDGVVASETSETPSDDRFGGS